MKFVVQFPPYYEKKLHNGKVTIAAINGAQTTSDPEISNSYAERQQRMPSMPLCLLIVMPQLPVLEACQIRHAYLDFSVCFISILE